MITQNPGAWIVSKQDRGRKKIYRTKKTNKRKVYLTPKELFEIELYNPTSENFLARIKINGNYISNSGLVVKPGERIYLERYLEENKSFKFTTYSVEDTPNNRKAIKNNNGKVQVEFYPEIKPNSPLRKETPWWEKPWWEKPRWENPYYYTNYYHTNFGSGSGTNSNFIPINIDNLTENSDLNALFNISTESKIKNIETGFIGKGEKTNQSFKNIDMDFNNNLHTSVTYFLYPESRKKKTKKDLDYFQRSEISESLSIGNDIVLDKIERATQLLSSIKNLYKSQAISKKEYQLLKEKILRFKE